jgi:hypothetical protein
MTPSEFMLKHAFAATILFCFLSCSAKAADAEGICAHDSRVVEPCYNVHGRLAFYMNMRAYLGVPETKRRLGIVFSSVPLDSPYIWPSIIDKTLTPDNEIWADYRVCPFTPQKPGVMQMVCIDAVSNMHVVPLDKPK